MADDLTAELAEALRESVRQLRVYREFFVGIATLENQTVRPAVRDRSEACVDVAIGLLARYDASRAESGNDG